MKNKNNFNKTSIIFEVLGELDELNSLIGIIKNLIKKFRKELNEIQENLFIIQAQIASYAFKKFKPPKIKEEKILILNKKINDIKKKIIVKNKFVIPGENLKIGLLDFLRAVVRRIERRLLKLNKKYKLDKKTLEYIDKLSTYLYLLARFIAYKNKLKEKHPSYK